jgi:Flp pilus assembly protein TadD
VPESQAARFLKRAESYLKQTKYKEALAYAGQAILLEPKNTAGYTLRAAIKSEMGEYAAAVADCDLALAINPNYEDALSKKALALYQLEQYVPALAAATRAVTLNANDASAWYIRGICLEETGKSEEAEIAYAKSLELEIILDIKEESRHVRK